MTERDEWAKSLPDGKVGKKGTLLCPSCNSHRLDRCLGGVGHYECAECGQLFWDPNLPKSVGGGGAGWISSLL